MQFECGHKTAWEELLRALFDGRSIHERAMEQFNELRADAIQRIT